LASQYRHKYGYERRGTLTGPGYDLLVILHVLSAVVGFGAVGVSGSYAARARLAVRPREQELLVRYFAPGTNWAERCLLVTPVLGAVVLVVGDRPAASQAWPWIGLGCWVVAAGISSSWCWPAERRVQAWLSGSSGALGAGDGISSFRDACRAVELASLAISVCFLGAVVVMIWQPG
jgi:hypothetical protein